MISLINLAFSADKYCNIYLKLAMEQKKSLSTRILQKVICCSSSVAEIYQRHNYIDDDTILRMTGDILYVAIAMCT